MSSKSAAIQAPSMTTASLRLLGLPLAYFVTGWLGLQMPYAGSQITLVWLPTGVAVAALLSWGRTAWPGIYLGAFLVNLAIGSSWQLAAGIAVGNTLAPLLSVACLKLTGFHPAFDRQRDVGLFILSACVGMLVSASGGIANLSLAGLLPPANMASAWLSWWMGDTVGVFLAAPLLLTLTRKNLEQLDRVRWELLLWFLLASALALFAFVLDDDRDGSSLPLAFLTLPMLTWAALRFGKTGTALAGLGFSVVAAWSTATGHGFFMLNNVHEGILLLWGYMAITVLTGLLITALQAERLQVESTLRESEAKLRGLYELSPVGISLTDMRGRYVEFNQAFMNICGYPAEELKKLDYWALTPKQYGADEARQLETLKHTGCYGPYEKEYVRKDGSLIPLCLNSMLITGSDDQKYIWSIVEDISKRKQTEMDLRIAATAFQADVGIIITDADSVILRVNQAFIEQSGYAAAEVVGQTPRLFQSGRHDAAFYEEMWQKITCTGSWQGEIWDRRKSGEIYPKWLTITAIKDGDGTLTHYVGTQVDITERKAWENTVNNLAFYDPLTQLPNRRLLFDRLDQANSFSERSGKTGALLFIDLDNFKSINDTLGHAMGDFLLQEVAQRLTSCVRGIDSVARMGGDEFVVMLEDLGQDALDAAKQAEAIGEKILAALNQTYHLDGHEYYGTTSIGIALFNNHQLDIKDILKQADIAMYQAKSAGRNTLRFFDPQMQESINSRAALETELRKALELQQFRLFYQIQVGHTHRPLGAEALIRWIHPERGMVSPAQFIPLAEESGLIVDIGLWVLETACAQIKMWEQNALTRELILAVNVSAKQFRQAGFVSQVQALVQRYGINPSLLKLELTESMLLENIADVIATMEALKETGVRFSLDDFGTGYSSLQYLKRLPLDQLKIDQSFVRDIVIDESDKAIVRTIISMAHSLGLNVIAEGVETEQQRQYLLSMDCTHFQGYLFGKPVPIEQFEALLTNNTQVRV